MTAEHNHMTLQKYVSFTGGGNSAKVAFLCPNTAVYSVVQWACWISGQIGELGDPGA